MKGNFNQYINTGMIVTNAIYLVVSQTLMLQSLYKGIEEK